MNSTAMESIFDSHHLAFKKPEEYRQFRNVLDEAAYTDSGIMAALGIDNPSTINEADVPLLLRRTAGASSLDTLIRLFLIEQPVKYGPAARTFKPMTIDQLAEAGLVSVKDDEVFPLVKLLPYRDLVLAFDSLQILRSSARHRYVMGIGSSSLTLANLTVRKHAGRTLDLGTGCGFQAFMSAPHSDSVLAVDRNPRAIEFTAFNALINTRSNVEAVEGDLFEPAAGREFDLIVSNPPFVISPESRYIYRDSGMPADQVVRKIISEVPRHLRENGYCQILCNWAESDSKPWEQRLQEWFADAGCDVLVLRSETHSAEAYATKWIRHTERGQSTEEFIRRFDEWLDYFAEHKIDAVGAGLITMRKRGSGPNWFRADDAPGNMKGPCGDSIVRRFTAHDFLAALDDKKILDARLVVSPDVRLERLSVPSDRGWVDDVVRIGMASGLNYKANIDAMVANLVVRCDGGRRLGRLLTDMAESLDRSPGDIAPDFCIIVRGLLEHGFLVPVGWQPLTG